MGEKVVPRVLFYFGVGGDSWSGIRNPLPRVSGTPGGEPACLEWAQVSGASRAKEDGQLVRTQVGEERDAVTGGVCEESAHGRHRPSTRVAEGKGRARGKPPCRASTKCRQVLSTLRLPALRRLRAGTGALAFLWAGRHTGCYRDPSRLLGRGGGRRRTPGLRACGSPTSAPL